MTTTHPQVLARAGEIEARAGYVRAAAWGLGLAHLSTVAASGGGRRILDTWFPVVNRDEAHVIAAILSEAAGLLGCGVAYLGQEQLAAAQAALEPLRHDGHRHPNLEALDALANALAHPRRVGPVELPRAVVLVKIRDLAERPHDAHDVYLRLHLLSHRKVKPHGANLDNIFALLNTVAWTSAGPLDVEDVERIRLLAAAQGVHFTVHGVDKFPRMVDYVTPSGVRIASAAQVRLGAYLAEGTTVMPAGFVNFNAGTLGKAMVEGRISAGVTVGAGTDIGGGASIMGTLSGGGTIVISVGEHCLLGANSGLGIPLGDHCTVESGLYVTAGSKVRLPDGTVVKAAELAGRSDLLFRRNSQTGAIEVLFKKNEIRLNEALHTTANAPPAP
ncbi:MAG: 2,3,4,5-tetrahydropyridine-2,6-dicarboxylate N-succinyltransferase [Planctomycetes bacterium]|nr:2,3,4,5-tetrahydropyridine-2,6-dicarboxylate N-succinyltransferase [Planctomycetota bacterium]